LGFRNAPRDDAKVLNDGEMRRRERGGVPAFVRKAGFIRGGSAAAAAAYDIQCSRLYLFY